MLKTRNRRIIAPVVLAGVLLSTSAIAQEEREPFKGEGSTLRLSLSAPLFSVVNTTGDLNDAKLSSSQTRLGLPADAANVGLGVAPNRTINFGLELHAASQSTTAKSDNNDILDVKTSEFGISPYFEAAFAETGFARTFVRGQLTFASSSQTTRDPVYGDRIEDTVGLFRLATGFGVQLFPVEQLSVDLRMDLAYATLTNSGDSFAEDLKTGGIGVLGIFGISGWFGRQSPRTPSATTEEQQFGGLPQDELHQVGTVEPEMAPAGGREIESDGSIKLRLQGRVVVQLDPPDDGDAEVTFIVPASTVDGKSCEDPSYFYGDKTRPLKLEQTEIANGSSELIVMRGELSAKDLKRISRRKAKSTGFTLCGVNFEVYSTHRKTLRHYRKLMLNAKSATPQAPELSEDASEGETPNIEE